MFLVLTFVRLEEKSKGLGKLLIMLDADIFRVGGKPERSTRKYVESTNRTLEALHLVFKHFRDVSMFQHLL